MSPSLALPENFVSCPRCPGRFADGATLEKHLVERHLLSPAQAQWLVRDDGDASPQPATPMPTAPQELPMPKKTEARAQMKCKGCGAVGRRQDSCPKCNVTARKLKVSPTPKSIEKVVVDDNGARATSKILLGQLETLRARLDDKINQVRELTKIL